MALIKIENIPEKVTRDISEKIIRNELKAGERIYEAKIAEEMGISRSPVREALRLLESNKLVELIPRKGARVTEISEAHIEWFYDVFEVLYGLVARKGIENAGDEDRADLLAAFQKIESSAVENDVEGYFEGIFEFAGVGMRAACNPLLAKVLSDLWPSNRRIQYATLSCRKFDLSRNVEFFREIVNQMDAGKPLEAEAIVKTYAQNEKRAALEMIYGDKNGNEMKEERKNGITAAGI